jgi:hypothetical protein
LYLTNEKYSRNYWHMVLSLFLVLVIVIVPKFLNI